MFHFWSKAAIALLISAGLAAALPTTARAAERRGEAAASATVSFDALVEQGLVAYRARDYRKAVEKFLQANAMQPDPNLMFNMARCYEALGDTKAAAEKYRLFLDSPDAEPSGRQRAQERLRVLRRRPAGSPGETEALGASEALAESDRPGRNTLAVLGAVTGAAGVAAGALAYGLGLRDHRQVTGAAGYGVPGAVHPLTEVQAQRLAVAGRQKKTVGAVVLGAGGVLLAASLAAVLLSPSSRESSSLAMGLTPEQNGGGLLLSGRF